MCGGLNVRGLNVLGFECVWGLNVWGFECEGV